MNRPTARHALAIAALVDACAALALILASLTGESARTLTPQLIVFGFLNALLALALIGDARIREHRARRQIPLDAPDRDRDGWVPEQYRNRHDDGI